MGSDLSTWTHGDSSGVPRPDIQAQVGKSRSQWATTHIDTEAPRQWTVAHEPAGPLSSRMAHIMSSAGYMPQEPSEYDIQAKEMLERLLEKNPNNAEARQLYQTNRYRFVFDALQPPPATMIRPPGA
jgi:hypothetical protein